jgi:penicillin G amidase
MLKKSLLSTLIICLGLLGRYIYQKKLPLVSFTNHQVKKEVEISIDSRGVPTIKAQSWADAQFGLGYMMAHDRLWQMEVLRRASSGRLSELFGEKTIKVDKLMRTLRLRSSMEDYLLKNEIEPKIQNLINPFINGINTFIAQKNYPIEFDMLGFNPEPWNLTDVLAISGIVTFSFAEGMILDALVASLLSDFSVDQVSELLQKVKNDQQYKNFKSSSENVQVSTVLNGIVDILDEFSHPIGFFKGSNSWVISGKKTKSGKPILSNDPHIAFSNPSFWYEANIKTPEHSMYGYYLPGVGFAGLGQNEHKAWAITMSEMDDADMFIEKLNPNNSEEVMEKGEWVPLKKTVEEIFVKGKNNPIDFPVYESTHGPLLNGTKYDRGIALSLKWAFHHPKNHILKTFYELNTAKTVKEVSSAISYAAAPGFNVSSVDKNGNIGWHVMGLIAKRPNGASGLYPLEGWSGKYDQFNYLKPSENPHLYNPEQGFIASANYYPQVDFGHSFNGQWQPEERFRRLQKILPSKNDWDSESIKPIFLDNFVQGKDEIVRILNKVAPNHELVQELNQWDGICGVDSSACSIYYYFSRVFMENILEDQLGKERFNAFSKTADYWQTYRNFLRVKSNTWFKKQKKRYIEEALNITQKELSNRFGESIENWAWGFLHTIEYKHLIGQKKPFNLLFNLGPFPAPGGYSQINNFAAPRGDKSFNVKSGPSTRRIVDFGDTDVFYSVLPTGNNGNLLSPYFDDQVSSFLKGEFFQVDLKNITPVAFKIKPKIN